MRPKRWFTAALLALLAIVPTANAIDVAPGLGGATVNVAGSGAGQGTTSGTSTTGFGKNWYPSTITGSVAAGQGMVAFFDGADLNVAFLRRSTTCGNCLQVAISTDGGVTGTFFSTSAIIGNTVQAAIRVPASTVRYIVSNIGGPLNIFQSASLASGWTTVVGLANPVLSFATKPDGSRVLSSDTGGNVCISTDAGINFGSCSAAGGGIIQYAGGTTWLLFEGVAGNIRRSTDDGVSFSLVTSFGTNAQAMICLSPTYTTCVAKSADGNVRRTTDAGLTWPSIVLSGLGAAGHSLCQAATQTPVILSGSPPIGLAIIEQDSFTSFNDGVAWFPGQVNGSPWDGTGAPGHRSMECRNGRGIATYETTGGGVNVFAEYNPLTQPGGVLQSSAGGYTIAAPIQSGIILNAAPTVSAANTAAVVTLTNTPGSRICVRRIEIFNTGAAGNFTVTVTDGAVIVLNLGTLIFAAPPQSSQFRDGAPLLCSSTNNNLVVNIGAGGAGAISTTSVIADRYPN